MSRNRSPGRALTVAIAFITVAALLVIIAAIANASTARRDISPFWRPITMQLTYLAVLDKQSLLADQDTALRLGESICRALKAGVPETTVAASGVQHGYSPHDAGYVVGAARESLCTL